MSAILAAVADDEVEALLLDHEASAVAYDPHDGLLWVGEARGGSLTLFDRTRRRGSLWLGGPHEQLRLGGLAITPGGTIYGTLLGCAGGGTVIAIDPDATTTPLDGASGRYKWLGITYDPLDNVLYATRFRKCAHGAADGAIVEIDLTSGALATVCDGFAKPIGVVKLGTTLVVSDARKGGVFRVELVGGRAFSRSLLAPMDRPDAICACDRYSVFVTSYHEGSHRGAVHRLWLDGRSELIAAGPWEPRGVATDGEHVYVTGHHLHRVLVFRA